MKIVIIGGSHAGIMVADNLLQITSEHEIEIYDRNFVSSFATEDISAYIRGDIDKLTNLHFDTDKITNSEKVHLFQAHTVINLNTYLHQLTILDRKQNKIFKKNYDKLVIASGASHRLPNILGVENNNIISVRSYRQAEILKEKLANSQRVAVIGDGRSGIELALSIKKLQKDVHIFAQHDSLAIGYVGQKASIWLQKLMDDNGVTIHNQSEVLEFQQQANNAIILKTTQGEYTTDLVILALGFVPSTFFIKKGIDIRLNGAILVNDYLQTSDADIYALGDCTDVNFKSNLKIIETRSSTRAVRQAFVVAHNILGQRYRFVPLQNTSSLQVFDNWFSQTGLTLEQAKNLGYQANLISYEGPYIQEYENKTSQVTVYLTYDIDNRQILGVQIICHKNISQCISSVAIMIQNKNTIDDLAQADILYEQGNGMPLNFLNIVAQRAVTFERHMGRDKPIITLR